MIAFDAAKGYIIAGVLVFVLGLVATIAYLSKKVDTLQVVNGELGAQVVQASQTILDQDLQIDDLRKEAVRTGQLLLRRENALIKVRRQLKWSENEIADYFKQDAEAKRWADSAVPRGVVERLFLEQEAAISDSDQGGEAVPTTGIDARLPDTAGANEGPSP